MVGFLGLPARFLVPIPLLSLVEVLICFSLAYSVQCSPVKYHPVSMFFPQGSFLSLRNSPGTFFLFMGKLLFPKFEKWDSN